MKKLLNKWINIISTYYNTTHKIGWQRILLELNPSLKNN